MAKKEVIKNICLSKEEARRVDSNAYVNNLSVSQYLADPPNMLYKVIPLIGIDSPIKLHLDGRIEYVRSQYDMPFRYKRRLVERILAIKEDNPFRGEENLPYGQPLLDDYFGLIYIKLEDKTDDNDKV